MLPALRQTPCTRQWKSTESDRSSLSTPQDLMTRASLARSVSKRQKTLLPKRMSPSLYSHRKESPEKKRTSQKNTHGSLFFSRKKFLLSVCLINATHSPLLLNRTYFL